MKHRRILIIAMIGIVVSFVAAGLVAVSSMRSVISQNNRQMTETAAVSLYNDIDRRISEPKIVAAMMAKSDQLIDAAQKQNETAIINYLFSIKRNYGYELAFYVDAATRTYYKQDGISTDTEGVYSIGTWYEELMDSNKIMDFNINFKDAETQTVMFFINQKLYDRRGNCLGVCGVGNVIPLFDDVFKQYQTTYNLGIYIVNEYGDVLMGTDPEINPKDLQTATSIMQRGSEYYFERSSSGGWIVTKDIEFSTDWQLVIVKADEDYGSFGSMITGMIIVFVVVMLVLGAIFFLGFGKMQGDLEHQFDMTKALTQGIEAVLFVDLTHDTYHMEASLSDAMTERSSPRELIATGGHSLTLTARKYCAQFVCEEDREYIQNELDIRTIREKLKERSNYYLQYRALRKDGGTTYFEIHISKAPDKSKRKNNMAFLSLRNIDEQKAKEIEQEKALTEAFYAANRANEAKTNFMSSMSHDIRTPLNAIIGMTAIASAHIDDRSKVEHCLTEITSSSRHLLALINEVLDMNRIESGKISLSIETFDLPTMIDNVVTIANPLMKEKNHTFTVNVSNIKHEKVLGDWGRIQQCLINFIGNAVKYTPEGGKISLSVEERPTNRPKRGCFVFEVEDNGIGMTEEFCEKIFEPFVRADDQRAQKQQGTGLGMSITRSIVQMMNGDVKVESKLNEGSKFIATIFLELPDTEEAHPDGDLQGQTAAAANDAPGASLHQYQKTDFSDKRVLLAEDNEINAEIAMEILGMTGLKVDHAWNGKEAVDMLENSEPGTYDLVFMDIQMPVMDGYEATRTIRASQREDLQKIPILAMSANAFAEDVQHSKEAGMNDHIAKPLDFERLMQVMKQFL